MLIGLARAQAPADPALPSPVEDRSYKLLWENDDWNFLRDPALRNDFWDPIKYVRLSPVLDDWYLTVGGEVRQVWEQAGNDNWGKSPYMNAF